MANKEVKPEFADAKVYIGKREQPVAIIRKGDIKSYLTDEFWDYYSIWSDFNAGLGLPFGEGTAKYPAVFLVILKAFTFQWRNLNANL